MIPLSSQIAWVAHEAAEIERVAVALPDHERLQNRLALAKATLSTLKRLKEGADNGLEVVTR